MSDFVYAIPDEYPTHPNTSPARAAVQLEDFLSSVAAEQVARTVETLDAQLMGTRAALALIEERLEAISRSVFVPIEEVRSLESTMHQAQDQLADARRRLSDAYAAKMALEDSRKVAEAQVMAGVEGKNETERKANFTLALAADGDYRQVYSAYMTAVLDHERAQGDYDLTEKKHQAIRGVLDLWSGWLRATAK